MGWKATVSAFALVGAILISAAHDHMLGWGTAVAVVATLHNIWLRTRFLRQPAGAPPELDIKSPVPRAPAEWKPQIMQNWPEEWKHSWLVTTTEEAVA